MALVPHLAIAFYKLKQLDCSNNTQLPLISVTGMHITSEIIVDYTCTLPLFQKSLKCAFDSAFSPGAVFLVPKAIDSKACMHLAPQMLQIHHLSFSFVSYRCAACSLSLNSINLGCCLALLPMPLSVSLVPSCSNGFVVMLLVSSLAATSCLQGEVVGSSPTHTNELSALSLRSFIGYTG